MGQTLYNDPSTERGGFTVRISSVREYLSRIGVHDPEQPRLDVQLASAFQRMPFEIGSNPIKERMLRDVLRGGTLPPLIVYESPDHSLEVIDGLQRTHVLLEALRALRALEKGHQLVGYAQQQLRAIKEDGREPLTADALLDRPIVLQVWHGLKPDERVRLFMLLNTGQQRVSPRHLLEVANADLRMMFEAWDIRVLTEKEEGLIPRRRGRKRPETMGLPSATHFRLDFLIESLMAYASGDPQIKTRHLLEEEHSPSKGGPGRFSEIGGGASRIDLQWVCLDLNKAINRRYADYPKWRSILQTSDNFLVPLVAALGAERTTATSSSELESHKEQLLRLMRDSWHDDPLRFFSGGGQALEKVLDRVRSNIGRTRRAIVYAAWRSFFNRGIRRQDSPINWAEAG